MVEQENIQWSNADIEFPSTSTSDEIEIISAPDDSLCAPLSLLSFVEEIEQIKKNQEQNENKIDTINFAEALGKCILSKTKTFK